VQDFRQLQVWRKAHQLNLLLYAATRDFPRSELFGLTSQIRRAATSITANLAEGRGRGSDSDFRRFVFIAMGSACEVESHPELAKDLQFLSAGDYRKALDQLIEIKRMLSGLIATLKADG
jgi:four helix bundle protein